MCQSIAEGGRRCAAHHPATLAFKHYSKNVTGLEQGQADYLFKRLRAAGSETQQPTLGEYSAFLNFKKRVIGSDGSISRRNRNSLIQKIDNALVELNQIPDAGTFFALQNMQEHGEIFKSELASEIRASAERHGVSEREMNQNFKNAYKNTVNPRGGNTDDLFDHRTRETLELLSGDRPAPRFEEEPRISRTSCNRASIKEYGYDPEDGRLEVVVRDSQARNTTYAYHGVPQEVYDRFEQAPVATFNKIRSSHLYNYDDSDEAQRDAYRVWCEDCHEYKLASGHACEGNEGRTTGSIVTPADEATESARHNIDEILSRVAGTNEVVGTTPSQPDWGVGERETVELDSEHYINVLGAQSSTPSHAQMIYPKTMVLAMLAEEGKDVTFQVGRKIYVRGTGRREWNEVTEEYMLKKAPGDSDEMFIVPAHDSPRKIKCTCAEYQANYRCEHIYPRNGSRMNLLVTQDITNALNEVHDGLAEEGKFIPPSWRGTEEVLPAAVVEARGEEDSNGMPTLSDEQAEGILYEVLRGNKVDVVFPNEGEDYYNGIVRFSQGAWGNLSMQEVTNFSGYENLTGFQARMESKYNSTLPVRQRLARESGNVFEGWEIDSNTREENLARFGNSMPREERYLNNPDSFIRDYQEAMDNEPVFRMESITEGMLSNVHGQGRGFGVEIEIGCNYRDRDRIGIALQEAGLSESRYMAHYHAENDYDSWRIEEDGSVDAEIVSPILYDTPESWEQLKKVCDIIKENGGRATVHTGNHVHIGASRSREDRVGAFAAAVSHQDVIRRLATNPESGTHRTAGLYAGYTAPFDRNDIANVYSSSRSLNYLNRSSMLNFGTGSRTSHTIEFRDPDGSLDPAHIQANVLMSAAIARAGENRGWGELDAASVNMQRVGINAMREDRIRAMIEDPEERILAENISVMSSLDALFTTKEQKKLILSNLLRSPWQR